MQKRKDSKGRRLKSGESERSDGRYMYRYTDKYQKRHTLYAKNLTELREKESQIVMENALGIKNTQSFIVNDIYYKWKSLKQGLKKNTYSNYVYMYETYALRHIGLLKLKEVKKSDVRGFYKSLRENKNLTISSIDNVHTVLHQVFELAVEDDLIIKNPSDKALVELKRASNQPKTKKEALTLEDQQALESHLSLYPPCKKWKMIITTFLYTGMRVGELTGLRWEDVDMEKRTISVNHALVYLAERTGVKDSKSYFTISTPKTKAGTREIPMLPQVYEALKEEKEYQNELGIQSKTELYDENRQLYKDFIFINRFGHVQNQATINKAFHRLVREMNFKRIDKDLEPIAHFSCHILRHTFTTRLCEANVNVKTMQYILGHKDIQTTLNIYASVSKKMKEDAVSDLGKYFDTNLNIDTNEDINTDNEMTPILTPT